MNRLNSSLLICVAVALGVHSSAVAAESKARPGHLNSLITALENQGNKPLVYGDLYTFYDMEHPPFDVSAMREAMLSGKVPKGKPIIARISAYGWELEKNLWQVKQVLDAGVHGVIFPRIETQDQAVTAIRAMRYPQRPGAADYEPGGLRGWLPSIAAEYWGVDAATYMQHADLWGLDPKGELVAVLLIESREGVKNVHAIAGAMNRLNVKVILWAGAGDLSIDYCGEPNCQIDGRPMPEAADLERGLRAILAAGKEFGMPVQMNSPVVSDPKTGLPITQDMAAHIKQRMEQGARLFPKIN